MTTEKDPPKLDVNDVRAIFESLHDKKPVPVGLKFQIVYVGPDGQGLSPPNHEYDDGIYVLLKPDKSKRKQAKKERSKEKDETPKIPSHLYHLAMKTPLSNITKWSLSGPQFPRPTAFQQRYCYPQGQSDYARKKGAALWTMYTVDGKEDKEFRILHVYFSTKRANNSGQGGAAISRKPKLPLKSISKKAAKLKRKIEDRNDRNDEKQKKQLLDLRFGLHPSVCQDLSLSPPQKPCDSKIFRSSLVGISPSTASPSSGKREKNSSKDFTSQGGLWMHDIHPVSSFLLNDDTRLNETRETWKGDAGNAFQEIVHHDISRHYDEMMGIGLPDPSLMMTTEPSEWSSLIDATDQKANATWITQQNDSSHDLLVSKLNFVHQKIIHEWIGGRPRSEQGQLVNVLANWARYVSKSPLHLVSLSELGSENRDDIANGSGEVDLSTNKDGMAVAI